jgi:hypothetical protein
MSRELISKATRNEFREALTSYVLREIDMFFEAGGITPRRDYDPQVGGQRRCLVECYYANLDFASAADVKKLLTVYEEVIENLQQVAEQNPESQNVTMNALLRRMARDGFRFENGRFAAAGPNAAIVHAPSLVQLTEESIQEHVEKARQKIANGDSAGAIANTYTLVEEFMKQLLRKTGTTFNESEGDIRALYKAVCTPLHLDPKGESLENYLKAILEGLQRQISGLFEVANKASDRHARRYNPAPHHARLAVNAAFTLCEFLLESFEYQQKKEKRHAS